MEVLGVVVLIVLLLAVLVEVLVLVVLMLLLVLVLEVRRLRKSGGIKIWNPFSSPEYEQTSLFRGNSRSAPAFHFLFETLFSWTERKLPGQR